MKNNRKNVEYRLDETKIWHLQGVSSQTSCLDWQVLRISLVKTLHKSTLLSTSKGINIEGKCYATRVR